MSRARHVKPHVDMAAMRAVSGGGAPFKHGKSPASVLYVRHRNPIGTGVAREKDIFGPGMAHGMRLWRKYFAELLALRGDATTVVSYPKSGRTWHRALLAHYLSTQYLKIEPRSIDIADLNDLDTFSVDVDNDPRS